MRMGDWTGLRSLAARIGAAVSDRRGASAVEFAFVAPVLLFFTVGVMDVGRVVWLSSTLESVAADTARFAMIRGAGSDSPASLTDIADFAASRAIGIPAAELGVDVHYSPNNNPGASVRIELTYDFKSFLTGFIDFGPLRLQGIASRIVL